VPGLAAAAVDEGAMKYLKIAGLLLIIISAPLLCLALWPRDNETTADIKGHAPPGGGPKSQAELSPKMKGQQ
jgi:hypothetical protein